MPSFDAYNTFLQSEEPLVHLLQDRTLNLYKALLSRFIKPDVIAQSEDIRCINIEDSTNYREYSSIRIGFSTKQYALSKDLIGTSKYTKFLRKGQQFYIKACSYLLKPTPVLHDPIPKSLSVFLKSSERLNVEEDYLATLISRFPLVIPTENIDKLEFELLDYQTANNTELPRTENDDNQKRKRIDQYWLEVLLMNDAATETPLFSNLSNLARFLLLIPHSNTFCEGVFSIVKKILTNSRDNLGKDVIRGHAHSSVYEDETGIRNKLVGLLIAKINIFQQQQITCYE